MKVSIIGAGGLVGSCTAFALQTGKIVREIALLDAARAQVQKGEHHRAQLLLDGHAQRFGSSGALAREAELLRSQIRGKAKQRRASVRERR